MQSSCSRARSLSAFLVFVHLHVPLRMHVCARARRNVYACAFHSPVVGTRQKECAHTSSSHKPSSSMVKMMMPSPYECTSACVCIYVQVHMPLFSHIRASAYAFTHLTSINASNNRFVYSALGPPSSFWISASRLSLVSISSLFSSASCKR